MHIKSEREVGVLIFHMTTRNNIIHKRQRETPKDEKNTKRDIGR